jgi:hypothetical protein
MPEQIAEPFGLKKSPVPADVIPVTGRLTTTIVAVRICSTTTRRILSLSAQVVDNSVEERPHPVHSMGNTGDQRAVRAGSEDACQVLSRVSCTVESHRCNGYDLRKQRVVHRIHRTYPCCSSLYLQTTDESQPSTARCGLDLAANGPKGG